LEQQPSLPVLSQPLRPVLITKTVYVINIDTILQQNAPDYGRMVAKAWNTTFIAPCNGYLIMKTVQVVSYVSYININGSTIAHSRNDRGDNGICSYQNIPINKGDSYIGTGTTQQLYFVPSKGGII
jgi:hypothetical protein